MDYFIGAFRDKYADFSGRARRAEYWWFTLVYIIAAIVVLVIDLAVGASFILYLLFIAATFIPGLAMVVRRLHDTNRSGWWYLVTFVPLVGSFILLYFLVTDGTQGQNRYGRSPKFNPQV